MEFCGLSRAQFAQCPWAFIVLIHRVLVVRFPCVAMVRSVKSAPPPPPTTKQVTPVHSMMLDSADESDESDDDVFLWLYFFNAFIDSKCGSTT